MDGEGVLRKLAAGQVEGLKRTPATRQLDEFKATFAYLSGALSALQGIGALNLSDSEGFALLHTLLGSVASPLEESGQLQRVEVSVMHESRPEIAVDDPSASLVNMLGQLQRFGVVTDEDVASIKQRINQRFPDASS